MVKTKNDSSAGKQPPPSVVSPIMKTKIKREPSTMMKQMKYANQIIIKKVGIQNVAIGLHFKANGIFPAYMGGILTHMETDEYMDKCLLVHVTNLKSPDGDKPHEVPNKQGNLYPVDVVVFATCGECTLEKAGTTYASCCNDIAKSQCRTEWKFGTPVFMFKGVSTPPDEPPLGHYLMSQDCIVVMKRIYEGISTKEAFLEKEERDAILTEVFGSAADGMNIIQSIPEEVFNGL